MIEITEPLAPGACCDTAPCTCQDAPALVPDGYYCDHSDEPWDAGTHHGWEWVEGEGNVFTHQPNTINAHIGFQEYLKPEDRETRCPRAEVVYRASKVTPLLAEIADLQAKLATAERQAAELANELAEEKAAHNPRLRCLIVKAAPDRDMYIGWSNNCEMPAGVWSRETALEYGFPPSRLDRADATGTSSHIGDGAWDDKGFVAEQRGWLKRDRLGDYAVEYLYGDRIAAYALLEPFEGETEVRR